MMNAKIENRYNVQFAKSYIVYMMASSYFKKAVCENKREEIHLYLHYCEMPQQKQLKQEDYVVRAIEKIDRRVLRKFENLQCNVRFEKIGEIYTIRFLTGLEEMIAEIDEKGYVDIRVYSVYSKLNRKAKENVVKCDFTVCMENGKYVLNFTEGLEQVIAQMKSTGNANIKFTYTVENKEEQMLSLAA